MNNLPEIIKNQKLRRNLTQESHFYFFHIYFGHYVRYETADFQKEIFKLTEDENIQTLGVVAFRGSAKSTIVNMSYPIWSILGKQQKKFVLILGQTQQQARQHLKNLKDELESNKLLKDDLGPFEEQEDEWHAYSLVLPKYGARITAASSEQSIRGIRHQAYRPDLIIGDDLEDLASVKTRESRDKTFQWLTSEVIPAGDRKTRLILIGNLLHEDSLLMRIKHLIKDGELHGVFREYPLLNEKGHCIWPGKYPDKKAIEADKKRVGSIKAWHREYLLNIVDDNEKVIHREWIKYYSQTPKKNKSSNYRFTAFAIDPAISERDGADYTAMVAAHVYGYGDDVVIYILPNPVCKRLTFLKTVSQALLLSSQLTTEGQRKPQIIVEDVAYQRSLIEQLKAKRVNVKAFKPGGQDKRARLSAASYFVQNGQVLFPKKGAEKLTQQLVNFGMERHDDLADAFAMLILEITRQKGSGVRLPTCDRTPGKFNNGPWRGLGNIWGKQF